MSNKLNDQIFNILESYINDVKFGECFKQIKNDDPYLNAKFQEDFLISNSYNVFKRLNNDYRDKVNFDSELDLKFGDFIDNYGNYYDLKVGLFNDKYNPQFCGGITLSSLNEFGRSYNNRHYYICINYDCSRCYIINAQILYNEYKKGLCVTAKNLDYLGEINYKKSKAIVKYIERKKK